jgi:DNA-binding transcriptional ArsR family regulator
MALEERWMASVVLVALAALALACKRSQRREMHPLEGRFEPVVLEVDDSLDGVRRLVERLRSDNEPARAAALAELDERSEEGFLPEQVTALLHAATLRFPAAGAGAAAVPGLVGDDTPAALVSAASVSAEVEHVALVERIFPELSAPARHQALELLVLVDDANAAALFMRLLREHAPTMTDAPLENLTAQPHHPEVFFPALLELAKHPARATDIYLAALFICQEGSIEGRQLATWAPALLEAYRREREWLLPRQRDKGSAWMWEEAYQEHRAMGSLLLDLLGCTASDAVESELVAALDYRDPRLVHFGVLALVKQGKAERVPAAAIERVAADAEMRAWLFEGLKALERRALFPARYLTQEALAEAEMVRWLVYPTELAQPPDAIELAKVVGVDTTEGPADYYLFKFRVSPPHPAAKDGWMVGTAGPFLRADEPTTEAQGGTFSSFEPWASRTPEEHVAHLRETIARAQEELADDAPDDGEPDDGEPDDGAPDDD